jgi:DNA-binding transcriptional LysR family regulator
VILAAAGLAGAGSRGGAAEQRYLLDCGRILAEIVDTERHAVGIHAAPRGMVSVTASVMFGRIVLAPVLHDLLDRYPEISVSAVFVDRVVHLMDEGIDVAVRIAELPDSTLSASRIGSVRRVLCASPDYIAARGRPRALADLAGHELINFSSMAPGGEWAFQKDGKTLSFRPRSRLLLNTADVAIATALAGRGVTRVLSYMIAPQVKQGSLQILLQDYEPPAVPIHIVHKEPGRTSARVRAVVDHLVQRLRRDPALQAERLD